MYTYNVHTQHTHTQTHTHTHTRNLGDKIPSNPGRLTIRSFVLSFVDEFM